MWYMPYLRKVAYWVSYLFVSVVFQPLVGQIYELLTVFQQATGRANIMKSNSHLVIADEAYRIIKLGMDNLSICKNTCGAKCIET